VKQAFLAAAERAQLFGNALRLPPHMPSRADAGGLEPVHRSSIGALVHKHYTCLAVSLT
jgi:hypothetical protein